MDGKQYLIDRCKELGVDYNKFLKIGRGKRRGDRFVYESPCTSRCDTQLFAIKYFIDDDLYVAWNLREPKAKAKNVFSLSGRKKAIQLISSKIEEHSKKIEYGDLGEEVVLTFTPEHVDDFLRRYIPIQRNSKRKGGSNNG